MNLEQGHNIVWNHLIKKQAPLEMETIKYYPYWNKVQIHGKMYYKANDNQSS